MAKNKVSIKFSADTTEFERGVKHVQKRIKNVGKSIEEFGKTTAFLTGPFIAFGAAAMKGAHEAQQAMATIRAGTGATGKALKDLESSFRTLWKNGPEGAGKVATALADLNTRLGLTGETLERTGRAVLDTSRMLGTDTARTIESLSNVLHTFNVGTEDSAQLLNDLFVTVQSSGVSFEALTKTLQRSGGALRSFGLDAQQSMDLVGQLSKAGLDAEQVKTAFTQAQNYINGNTDGVKDLHGLIEKLKTSTDAYTLARKAFGAEAGGAFLNVVQNNAVALDTLGQSLKDASNELNNAAKETLTTKERLLMLKNAVLSGLYPAGQAILDLADRTLPRLAGAFGSLSPAVQKCITYVGLFGAAVSPVTFLVGKFVSGLSGTVGTVLKTAKALRDTGARAWNFYRDAVKDCTSVAQTAVTAFQVTIKGLLSFLAGPGGLVAVVGAAAVALGSVFVSSTKKAQEELDKLKQIAEETKNVLAGMSDTGVKAEIGRLEAQKAAIEAKYQEKLAANSAAKKAPRDAFDMVAGAEGWWETQRRRIEENMKAELAPIEAKLKAAREEEADRGHLKKIQAAKTDAELDALASYKGGAFSSDISARRAELKYKTQELEQPAVAQPVIAEYKLPKFTAASISYKETPEEKAWKEAQARREERSRYNWLVKYGEISGADATQHWAQGLRGQADFGGGAPAWGEETRELYESFISQFKGQLDSLNEALKAKREALKAAGPEAKNAQEAETAAVEEHNRAVQALAASFADIPGTQREAAAAMQHMTETTTQTQQAVDQLAEATKKWTQDLQNGIVDAIVEGKSLSDVLGNIGKEMEKAALKMILFGNGGTGGLFGGLFGALGNLFAQKDGGVWSGGVQLYAQGGVVSAPHLFAHAGGLGVMGEAGPEAILPLKRGKNGGLGVVVTGGGASGGVTVNVTVHNDGGGNMTDEQARAMSEGLRQTVDTAVAEALYRQQRGGRF